MAKLYIEPSEIMASVAMLMTPSKLDEYSKDFQGLVDTGYFVDEASRLVILRADPAMQSDSLQKTIDDGITAVGHFRQYLNTVMQIGRMAEQGIKEDEETRQELLAEEL